MKLPCSIVRELLPLYLDGCLEPENQKLLEEHLKNCPDCTGCLNRERQAVEPTAGVSEEKEAEELRKSVKEVKKRLYNRSLKGTVAILLCLLLSWMGINEVRGLGVCFTNLDELVTARLFLNDLKNGDYASAYDRMDTENYYDSLLERWKNTSPETLDAALWLQKLEELGKEEYVRQGKELFCRYLEEADFSATLGVCSFSMIYRVEEEGWTINIHTQTGKEIEQITLFFEGRGFTASGGQDIVMDSGLISGALDAWHYELWELHCIA